MHAQISNGKHRTKMAGVYITVVINKVEAIISVQHQEKVYLLIGIVLSLTEIGCQHWDLTVYHLKCVTQPDISFTKSMTIPINFKC